MIPNTSTQSQDLFKDCLGFARQLSQSPGVYCKMEVKLGENSFKFETGNHGNFPGKRKSPSDYRRDQRRRKPPGKGVPTPGNHGVGSVAPGDPTGAQKGRISQAPSPPPCSRTVPWSKHLFSPSNIPQLDGAGSFISAEKQDIRTSTPTVAPLVQYECSGFNPLAPIQQLHRIQGRTPPDFDFVPLVQCEFGWSTPLAPILHIQPTTPPAPSQPGNSQPVDSSSQVQPTPPQLQPTSLTAPPQPVNSQPVDCSSQLQPTPPQPQPISTLPGYPLHQGPNSEEDEEDDNNWNYPGPLRGRLLPLKRELKNIWPQSKEFQINFRSGSSFNEITLETE